MTPPDAPDAPRDLLAMLEEIASEDAEENGEELWHCAAWGDFHRKDLRALCQRVRTAERERDRKCDESAAYFERNKHLHDELDASRAETARIREALGGGLTPMFDGGRVFLAARRVLDMVAAAPQGESLTPIQAEFIRRVLGEALGASRPGEPT